ncbi:MAG: precorrin-3B C(17)-methyltransferase [Ruminococcus sp.]|nr:precorrin-3B C(17)-methyltransferase [Ruminococcus sp.]
MKLNIVGFGAGNSGGMTLDARSALLESTLIVGYDTYIKLLKDIFPEKEYLSTGMRRERERVIIALEKAREQTVSLVCSGDPELYGMAGLAIELGADFPEVEITVVPGVSAAFSGGALLGAPLTNDAVIISLSDLLTPREKIENRLRCAAQADMVTVLYNPSSKNRADYLKRACDIFLEYRPADTVCGITRLIGREGQEARTMTLAELRETQTDMFTTVFIGNSETSLINGKMVTSRGYRNE